jgi:hypothetical protein
MRLRLAALLAASSLAAAAACSGVSPQVIAGTYGLSTVNSSPLPYLVGTTNGDSTFITGGTLILTTESWSLSTTARVDSAGQPSTVVIADSGTYGVTGDVLNLKSSIYASATLARVIDSTVTLPAVLGGQSSALLVFVKQ